MALLWMDSFDHDVTAGLPGKWTSGSGTITAGQGRHSSAGFAPSVGGSLAKTLATSGATAIVGFGFKTITSWPLQGVILTIANDSTMHVSLHTNTDGTLGVSRGGTPGSFPGTILGTTTFALSADTYYHIQLKVTIDDSAGTAEIRVNNSPKLTLTGLDTNNGGSAVWNQVILSQRSNTFWFDDVYVLDGSGSAPWNTFLGDCRVDARVPTGAGANTDWTPSTGANWSCVDDAAPNGDTDYVSAATSGLTDTYVMQDAPVAGAQIFGVQLLWHVKKLDAGTCSVAPVIRQGSTDLAGTDQDPTTTYAYQSQIYATNPHTTAAWTESDFNADEFGLSRTA